MAHSLDCRVSSPLSLFNASNSSSLEVKTDSSRNTNNLPCTPRRHDGPRSGASSLPPRPADRRHQASGSATEHYKQAPCGRCARTAAPRPGACALVPTGPPSAQAAARPSHFTAVQEHVRQVRQCAAAGLGPCSLRSATTGRKLARAGPATTGAGPSGPASRPQAAMAARGPLGGGVAPGGLAMAAPSGRWAEFRCQAQLSSSGSLWRRENWYVSPAHWGWAAVI